VYTDLSVLYDVIDVSAKHLWVVGGCIRYLFVCLHVLLSAPIRVHLSACMILLVTVCLARLCTLVVVNLL
jgi:hypothetical protein